MSEQNAILTQEELEQHKAEYFASGGTITVLPPQVSAKEAKYWKPAKATDKSSAFAQNSNSEDIGA